MAIPDPATIQITIKLNKNAPNKVRLIIQGNPKYLIEANTGDEIAWSAQGDIEKWLVAFLDPSAGGPSTANGSPLSSDPEGDAELEFRGSSGSVSTYVVAEPGRGDLDYRFGVAVLDGVGDLYLLDPEIRVRGTISREISG